jgi:hypothetical protein
MAAMYQSKTRVQGKPSEWLRKMPADSVLRGPDSKRLGQLCAPHGTESKNRKLIFQLFLLKK